MKNFLPVSLAVLSGILLYASWPASGITFLVFIAWIPLLYVTNIVQKKPAFFLYSFFTTLIWNACTTWWIWNATAPGAIAAIIANSLLMTLPWLGYYIFRKKYGTATGYVSLVVFWMMFEYIHLNWQLSWPWLTLGNIFATHPGWVQWYAYTGTGGGTLWIFLSNILLYTCLCNASKKKISAGITASAIVSLCAPFIISYIVKPAPATVENKQHFNVVIVQPDIDPYNEKFDQSTIAAQLSTLIALSEQKIDSNTRLVLWPETALPLAVVQGALPQAKVYTPVFDFIKKHPQLVVQTGIETYVTYGSNKATKTARFVAGDNIYYDAFNTAVALQAGTAPQFYNKSKLVPGVETLPDFLLWMAPLFESFGGTGNGYGRSKESAVFRSDNNPYQTAPVICYESIYGEYVAGYITKGANLITIMTNDGWWGNTPGYRQHFDYARLRAIETHTWVVRSANTGISAVINSKGDVLNSEPWDKAASIKADVPVGAAATFYVRYGDLLSKMALGLGVLLLLYHGYYWYRSRKKATHV